MGYTGTRRPTLIGRMGGFVSTALTFALAFWLAWTLFPHFHDSTDFVWLYVDLLFWLAIGIVLHESGHLLVGLASGEPVRKLRIGSGPTLFGFRARGLMVQLCLNPLGGGAVYFSEVGAPPSRFHLASLAAGPGVNLIAACYGLGLFWSATWVAVFGVANAILFITSTVPSASSDGVRQHPSDGLQIVRLLFRPQVERTSLEGAEIAADARTVLVRAIEDAQLSALQEVGDDSLLRALAQDDAVRRVFDSVGLTARIPPSKTPESDDLTAPKLSSAVTKAIEASFHVSRDLGGQKPNAAAICLGLLRIECPASVLMREAGITEESLRTLAGAPAEEEEDLRRQKVISADLPLERWGSAADKLLSYAFKVALADGSPFVGTNHLLAAIVANQECRAAHALARLGFMLVWKDVKADAADAPIATADRTLALSPQTGLALAGGLLRTGPNFPAGTAEVCLGILDQKAGAAAEILLAAGISADAFIKALRYTPREWSEPCGCSQASVGLWVLRASARMGAGRWLDARADFLLAEAAASTDLQRAVFANNVAWASLMSGDPAFHTESLQKTRAATAAEPDNVAIRGTHAFALLVNGLPADAAAILDADMASVTRPRDRASNLCLLAMCRARLGRGAEARELLSAAAEADAKSPLLPRAQSALDSATASVA